MVLLFRSPADVQVDVPADISGGVGASINRAVQSVLHEIAGVWRMSVRHSTERGRWRIELSGATGRHVWTIICSSEDLPELIAAKLRFFIETATARFRLEEWPWTK